MHLVVALRALKYFREDLNPAAAVEARLISGDRVLAEVNRPGHIRIALPIRMKVRGGRTWFSHQGREVGADADAARSAALKRLRSAHEAFALARPGLSPLRHVVRTARTPTADFRKYAWVFLAPDIQSAILTGGISTGAIAKLNTQKAIPLSWEAQRRLLGIDGAAQADMLGA
ncbi:hypothetical protein [Brevundimonas sp.]|uniref:hypothetical protein n=1 Tax=Brevundimonas sp. TaxID=1871086 RepID=UPI0025C2FA43|nr:hypothetical protein [Brevundimonas sp.]